MLSKRSSSDSDIWQDRRRVALFIRRMVRPIGAAPCVTLATSPWPVHVHRNICWAPRHRHTHEYNLLKRHNCKRMSSENFCTYSCELAFRTGEQLHAMPCAPQPCQLSSLKTCNRHCSDAFVLLDNRAKCVHVQSVSSQTERMLLNYWTLGRLQVYFPFPSKDESYVKELSSFLESAIFRTARMKSS